MSETANYENSMRTAAEKNPDAAITVDEQGRRAFGFLSASGLVEVEVPTSAGSFTPVVRMHARDFGAHVAQKIETAFGPDYFGAKAVPLATIHHYIGVAKGSKLLDSGAIRRMESMAEEFEKAPDKREFFASEVKPFLHSLTPKRR